MSSNQTFPRSQVFGAHSIFSKILIKPQILTLSPGKEYVDAGFVSVKATEHFCGLWHAFFKLLITATPQCLQYYCENDSNALCDCSQLCHHFQLCQCRQLYRDHLYSKHQQRYYYHTVWKLNKFVLLLYSRCTD